MPSICHNRVVDRQGFSYTGWLVGFGSLALEGRANCFWSPGIWLAAVCFVKDTVHNGIKVIILFCVYASEVVVANIREESLNLVDIVL
jgi:hypothetical protein